MQPLSFFLINKEDYYRGIRITEHGYCVGNLSSAFPFLVYAILICKQCDLLQFGPSPVKKK